MRADMAGASVIVGVIKAAASMSLPLNIRGESLIESSLNDNNDNINLIIMFIQVSFHFAKTCQVVWH